MNETANNLAIVIVLSAVAGCQSGGSDSDLVTVAPAAVTDQREAEFHHLTPETNNARSAAMLVATMPAVADPVARVEIQLQAALFRDAIQASRARFALLIPPDQDDQLTVGIPVREFKLRVLSELASVPGAVAWSVKTPSTGELRLFPGTREPAAIVRVGVIGRQERTAEVAAEWSVQHADGGGMRQGVLATWDGRQWVVEAENARMEW